ncbi:MAG: fatty acid desaturase, partial [Myxococcales bacterium]|nr:fatty acid desaturase [Myxococcales bacterium]
MIATRDIAGVDWRETARVWPRYLLMYVIPVTALAFVLTAPHPWYLAIVWNFIPTPLKLLDAKGIAVRENPEGLARAPFDVHVYLLAAMQLVTLGLFGAMVAEHGFWRVDTVVGVLLVGGAAANSTIVIAHELIHRRERIARLVGRLLLVSVFYEHFYTEHVRGHHVRVGTPEDPATARFGESFWHFYRRTIPAQFRSAWRLETARLGDVD